jgi:O-antigen ligase
LALALDARSGVPPQAPIALWPIAGLWLLGVLQLVPLPAWLLHLIAPGPSSVWYPSSPEAAAVLGPGPRPISLHPEATRRSLALATGIVALALSAVPALRVRRLLLRATVAIVVGGVAVALYALVARLVFGNKLYGIWSVPTVAPLGPFVNKNHFAGYVELAALVAVGLANGLAEEARRDRRWLSWIESRRAKWVVVAWGTAFVLVLAVLVSLSRGGVVAVSVGLVAFLLLRLWARGTSPLTARGLLTVVVLVLLGALGVAFLLPAEARARVVSLGAVTSDVSGSYRLAVWRDTARLVASSPVVGSGFGAYEEALRRFRTASGEVAVEHAESDVLEAAAEGGALGALGLLWLVGGLQLFGLRAARSQPPGLTRAVATGALAGILALAVHSLFDFNLHLPSNALLASGLAAVLIAITPDTGSPSRPLTLVVTTTTIAAAVLALTTTWRSTHLQTGPLLRATPSAARLRRVALEAELLGTLRRRPADATAWLALAWLRQTNGGSGRPLATWAVRLDPTNRELARAASRLLPSH